MKVGDLVVHPAWGLAVLAREHREKRDLLVWDEDKGASVVKLVKTSFVERCTRIEGPLEPALARTLAKLLASEAYDPRMGSPDLTPGT